MNEQVLLEARRLIAGFLRDRRKELGLTQVQLAQRTCLTEQTINRLEQAKFWPGMKQFIIIQRALGFSLSELDELLRM